jgi:hypothetical protein
VGLGAALGVEAEARQVAIGELAGVVDVAVADEVEAGGGPTAITH